MNLPVGVLVAAALLGVTHGVEPDHAAGISALTRDAEGRTHAAFVGACFAVGHVVVVLAWVALLTLLGTGVETVPDTVSTAGVVVPTLVLVLAAAALAASGVARLRGESTRIHDHRLAAVPLAGRLAREHDHQGRGDYLETGVVGSLFALSPPVSMLAFVTGVVPRTSVVALGGAVAVYAVAITATLATVGGGLRTLLAAVGGRSERVHGAFELVAAAVVLALALGVLGGH